eukprot:CAMPEP_0196656556 /NCGR_PEP_ID=MMETSP1086-20130531/17993_1 /TAXON_ID=77921 /ORGANISM="Cyanoptyche  gloeocystis , Strain SAG4.97" /LENGTH=178 /DNA_ID=CAMNT_0041989351 /DNA_START=407 /DNA_END=940 /DNA_ORIENTATION=-
MKQAEEMVSDVEALLERLSEINKCMRRCDGQTTTFVHSVTRHREILHAYAQECKKAKANMSIMKERIRLFESHSMDRSRDSLYKSGSGMEALLRERQSLSNSDRAADESVRSAFNARSSLNQQKSLLVGVGARMKGIQFGKVNQIIDANPDGSVATSSSYSLSLFSVQPWHCFTSGDP